MLPVLGVPMKSSALNGMDSLLSIVQMPAGVPVATLAIGEAGRKNAALLAVAILGNKYPEIGERLQKLARSGKLDSVLQDRLALSGGRQANRFFPGCASGSWAADSLAACSRLRRGAWAIASIRFRPDEDTPTGQVADVEVNAAYEDLDAVCRFASAVSVVTFEFENVPAEDSRSRGRCAPVRPSGQILHTTQQRLREKTFLSKSGLP